MPEPSRTDIPLRNPQGAGSEVLFLRGNEFSAAARRGGNLTSGDIYGELPRSRAESFGHSVGTAVSGVLRFPQRVGEATSRLRHAGNITRAQASAVVLDMMDTAAQRAENLRRTGGETLSGWARNARHRTTRFENRAAESWRDLRSAAEDRVVVASRRAIAQWDRTQQAVTRMREEDPVRFLAVVAGTAFVIGAGLRIWRSSRDD